MSAPAGQFRPLEIAREILAHPEGRDERLVEWANEVIREAECVEQRKSMPCKRP